MKPTTQDFLEIEQIRDGIIILKNKGLRMILMVSSLNFALKSEEEQNAIIYQFQEFLNSLDFPCQIVVQSRKINITGYLEKLKKFEIKENNELIKIQIKEYSEFINKLVETGSIMQKSFYVVIPFSLNEMIFNKNKKGVVISLTEEVFQRAKIQIVQRAEFVALGLKRCGLQAIPLNNLEITELFWSLYHQVEAEQGFYPNFPQDIS